MFCTKCGNQIGDGERFCTNCGAQAGGAAGDPKAGNAGGTTGSQKAKGVGKKRWIVIAAAAVAACAVIAIAVLIIVGVSSKHEERLVRERDSKEERFSDKEDEEGGEDAGASEKSMPEEEGASEEDAADGEVSGLTAQEMAEEDAELLQLVESESSYLRELLDDFVYEELDNSFLEMGAPVDYNEGFGLHLSYVRENQPANAGELRQRLNGGYGEYFLTEEQMEYVSSSICGRKVDFDFSSHPSRIDSYIAFGGGIGDRVEYNSLEKFSVERVDADTWKVRATDAYNNYSGISYEKSDVCFTVVRNPESCFDGYSLSYYEEKPMDVSWAQMYYDYMTKDPAGIAAMEALYAGLEWKSDYYGWNVIYVDDDMVPELYLGGSCWASGDLLLHISGGKVVYEYFTNWGGSYIPYSGWMLNDGGHSGVMWETIYRLENGVLQEKGNWESVEEYREYEVVGQSMTHYLDGKQVSQEQYEEFVRNSTGGADFQYCMGANYDYESCLNFLNGVIQRGMRY